MAADDPGLLVTQKLEPQKILAEQNARDAADAKAKSKAKAAVESDADKVDQSFIEELENSMSREISPDQLKA